MRWSANNTRHISRGQKLNILRAAGGTIVLELGQTCLNLTFRLIQCWTFFVELGFKRIYMMRSIFKDFKEFYKALNIYRGGRQWNLFSRKMLEMILINIIFSKWSVTSGAVCPGPQRSLVGGFPGCWGCPQPWKFLIHWESWERFRIYMNPALKLIRKVKERQRKFTWIQRRSIAWSSSPTGPLSFVPGQWSQYLLEQLKNEEKKLSKFTFLFKRITKAQMKILMARLTTPMATTRMERLSTEKPSEG